MYRLVYWIFLVFSLTIPAVGSSFAMPEGGRIREFDDYSQAELEALGLSERSANISAITDDEIERVPTVLQSLSNRPLGYRYSARTVPFTSNEYVEQSTNVGINVPSPNVQIHNHVVAGGLFKHEALLPLEVRIMLGFGLLLVPADWAAERIAFFAMEAIRCGLKFFVYAGNSMAKIIFYRMTGIRL